MRLPTSRQADVSTHIWGHVRDLQVPTPKTQCHCGPTASSSGNRTADLLHSWHTTCSTGAPTTQNTDFIQSLHCARQILLPRNFCTHKSLPTTPRQTPNGPGESRELTSLECRNVMLWDRYTQCTPSTKSTEKSSCMRSQALHCFRTWKWWVEPPAQHSGVHANKEDCWRVITSGMRSSNMPFWQCLLHKFTSYLPWLSPSITQQIWQKLGIPTVTFIPNT